MVAIAVFIPILWQYIGYHMLLMYASAKSISPDIYEAARIDGCSRFKQVIHITLPGILPTAIIILILSSGSIVSSNFEQVFGLQNLYTAAKTDIVGTVIYRMGIQNGEYSFATAFGLAQGLCAFVIVLISNQFAKKFSNQSIL